MTISKTASFSLLCSVIFLSFALPQKTYVLWERTARREQKPLKKRRNHRLYLTQGGRPLDHCSGGWKNEGGVYFKNVGQGTPQIKSREGLKGGWTHLAGVNSYRKGARKQWERRDDSVLFWPSMWGKMIHYHRGPATRDRRNRQTDWGRGGRRETWRPELSSSGKTPNPPVSSHSPLPINCYLPRRLNRTF